jgi:uncharacterized protein (DUF305 family)
MQKLLSAALVAAAFALPVAAQDHSNHAGHGAGANAPSTKAYLDANATMHKGMDIEFSGDADVDFVRGMIAHHQGAIDMAKVQLEYGKDAAIRTLSAEIIKAQEGEIAMMRDWLAKRGLK